MTYVVEKGHQDFRQGLRRQATGIKEATSMYYIELVHQFFF